MKVRKLYEEALGKERIVFFLMSDGDVARLHIYPAAERLDFLRPLEKFTSHFPDLKGRLTADDLLDRTNELNYFDGNSDSFPIKAKQIYEELSEFGHERVYFFMLESGDVARLTMGDNCQMVEFLRLSESLETNHAPYLQGLVNPSRLIERDDTITYF